MDSWVVGQISFWYTVRQVKPAVIVDKVIELFLDLVVPGRGAGETNWYVLLGQRLSSSLTVLHKTPFLNQNVASSLS